MSKNSRKNHSNLKIGILGAGIMGLTSAIRLTEHLPSAQICIYAEKFSPNTTSDVSAGYWEPYCLAGPESQQKKILEWGKETYDVMLKAAYSKEASQCGIQALTAYVLQTTDKPEIPFWSGIVNQFREMSSSDIRETFLDHDYPKLKSGYHFLTTTCVIAKYLPFLMNILKSRGVEFKQRKFRDMNDILSENITQNFDYFINCCGIGARDMLNDLNVHPIRGQVLRIKAPWIKCCVMVEDEEVTYMLPQSDTVVIGGTTEKNVYDTTPNEKEFERIVESCSKIIPSVKSAEILTKETGFRPSRSNGIRFELELVKTPNRTSPLKVIHNYGHGGSGITLSWGCASSVLDTVLNDLEYQIRSKL